MSPLDPDTGKPTISKEGRYVVQLWDVHTEKWENIVIDDLWVCREAVLALPALALTVPSAGADSAGAGGGRVC